MTYYCDPGTTKGTAVACFTAGRTGVPVGALTGLAQWTELDGFLALAGMFEQGPAVWEHPQYYPARGRETEQARTSKANALIKLAAAGSACANVLSWGRGGVRSVLPREWKRQIPKPMHHKHALTLLTPVEIALVCEAYANTNGKRGRIETVRADLDAYVHAGCLSVARNPGKALKGYSAAITDLLDAVTLGLTEEGRLVL